MQTNAGQNEVKQVPKWIRITSTFPGARGQLQTGVDFNFRDIKQCMSLTKQQRHMRFYISSLVSLLIPALSQTKRNQHSAFPLVIEIQGKLRGCD